MSCGGIEGRAPASGTAECMILESWSGGRRTCWELKSEPRSIPISPNAYSRGHKNYITRFCFCNQITLHFVGFQKIINFTLHVSVSADFFKRYTIPLLSCKYESLTQGNRLNPNHDGSSTERDVPNEFCVLRNRSLSRVRKQPTFFLSVYSCKHGRRRRSDRARCSQRERYVQGRISW